MRKVPYPRAHTAGASRFELGTSRLRVRGLIHLLNKSAKTYPAADVNSDYNLIVIQCRIALTNIKTKKNRIKWNLDAPKEETVRVLEEE